MPDLLLVVLVDVVTAGITSLVVTEIVWHHRKLHPIEIDA